MAFPLFPAAFTLAVPVSYLVDKMPHSVGAGRKQAEVTLKGVGGELHTVKWQWCNT